MKTWKWAVVAAAVLGLAAQASAADLKMPVKAAGATSHQVQAHNWTGFYIGAFGGYHDGKITQSGCVGLCPVDPKITGGLFGIQAGYDYQFQNNIVLGVFGWVPLTRPKTTISIGPGLDFHVNPQWAYAVAGRVGYAFDRLLPYVFGGIGVTKVEVHSDVTNITQDNTYRGPVVGAGFEYAVHRHVSLDFRYMYSSAPLKDYNFGGGIEQYGGRASSYLASVNFRF